MREIIKTNSYFLICCSIFFIFGAILLTQIETSDAIFFLSERRSNFGDLFFTYVTKMGEEVMYAIFFVAFLFKKIRYAFLIPLVGVLVAVISYFTKTFFAHDRPLMFLENAGLADQINFVEGVSLYTGQTSFPSGHTMSAFALYGMVAFFISKKKGWGIVLFVMALLIGVSRIYLVQHFFKDVYLGAWFGVAIALILYWLQNRIKVSESHWLNQPLWKRKKKKPIA